MQLDKIRIVARREYLQRFRSKGFWIGTVIFPVFMLAMAILPSLLMMRSGTKQNVVVIDETGRVAPNMSAKRPQKASPEPQEQMRMAEPSFIYEAPQPDRKAQEEALERRVRNKEIDAWIRVTAPVLTGERAEYH